MILYMFRIFGSADFESGCAKNPLVARMGVSTEQIKLSTITSTPYQLL